MLLIVFLAVACAVVAYSTWVWRMAAVEEDEPRGGRHGRAGGCAGRGLRGSRTASAGRGLGREPPTRRSGDLDRGVEPDDRDAGPRARRGRHRGA